MMTIITGNGKQLCYDGVSGRYFESSIQEIETAVNKITEYAIYEVTRKYRKYVMEQFFK